MVVTVRMMMEMKLVRVTRMARMARVTRIVRMARVRRMARVTWMARIIGRQKKGGGWSPAGSVVGVIGRGCCSRLVVCGYRGFGSAWVLGGLTYLPTSHICVSFDRLHSSPSLQGGPTDLVIYGR